MSHAIQELAADEAFTMDDFAREVSKAWNIKLSHQTLSEADYAAALKRNGVTEDLANALAEADVLAESRGLLYDDSHTLSKLIGRPTTSLSEYLQQTKPDQVLFQKR